MSLRICKYFTQYKRCFKCSYFEVCELNSKKNIRCWTSAGYIGKSKYKQKNIQVLIPDSIPFLVDLAIL